MFKLLLTNRVDVKEAHGCSEYAVEHAVVQGLCTPHQHVEQDQIPDKAESNGGYSQTCKRQKILLYTSDTAHSKDSAGDVLSQ